MTQPWITRSLLVLLTLVLLVPCGVADARTRVKEFAMKDAPQLAEGLTLLREDGSELDLSTLRGERVLLITWASW